MASLAGLCPQGTQEGRTGNKLEGKEEGRVTRKNETKGKDKDIFKERREEKEMWVQFG